MRIRLRLVFCQRALVGSGVRVGGIRNPVCLAQISSLIEFIRNKCSVSALVKPFSRLGADTKRNGCFGTFCSFEVCLDIENFVRRETGSFKQRTQMTFRACI